MRGVSAAEKYAELKAAGLGRPRCECHGELMYWRKDNRMRSGGRFQCAVDEREWQREWQREWMRECRKRKRLLRLLPDRLWLVEQSWPKEVAIARLAIGGATKAERETAGRKLDSILKKEKREWLSQLIISSAMQTTRRVTSFPLSLESSREG